jgi:hypothetical protein
MKFSIVLLLYLMGSVLASGISDTQDSDKFIVGGNDAQPEQ